MAVTLIKCKHLGDVLARISEEHVPDRWLYRGQLGRRPPHQFVDGETVFELEDLYPGSFRFVSGHAAITSAFYQNWAREQERADCLFQAFNSFLFSKYEASVGAKQTRFSWLGRYADAWRKLFEGPGLSVYAGFHERGIGLKDPELIRLSWSLAQHYEVVTGLLDVTYDPEVAAWFATNLWKEQQEPQHLKGEGVIYRFDIASLKGAMAFHNLSLSDSEGEYKAPQDRAFIQDIRHVPTDFASRPTRQHAAVISGLDSLRFIRHFDIVSRRADFGKIVAYTFPHLEDQGKRWPLTYSREFLIPPDDPFLDLKEEFETKWKPHAEVIYNVKYTKPVLILTHHGPKVGNVAPDQVSRKSETQRQELYDSGMASLAKDYVQAERNFREVIETDVARTMDRLSSLAHTRIAVIRFIQKDFEGAAKNLGLSLDGLEETHEEKWVGQLLQTILQGADHLRLAGKEDLAVPILRRAVLISHSSNPTALTLEAELGGMVLIGTLEMERGNVQVGWPYLEVVAAWPLSKLNIAQRGFVVTALHVLAQANERLLKKGCAVEIYRDIVARFAGDEWPSTIRIVARAREKFKQIESEGPALDAKT